MSCLVLSCPVLWLSCRILSFYVMPFRVLSVLRLPWAGNIPFILSSLHALSDREELQKKEEKNYRIKKHEETDPTCCCFGLDNTGSSYLFVVFASVFAFLHPWLHLRCLCLRTRNGLFFGLWFWFCFWLRDWMITNETKKKKDSCLHAPCSLLLPPPAGNYYHQEEQPTRKMRTNEQKTRQGTTRQDETIKDKQMNAHLIDNLETIDCSMGFIVHTLGAKTG